MSSGEIRYLSLAEVEALHIAIMERMGAYPSPFRAGGEGLLESAVMRPQMAAYYEGADMIRQSALLAVGISRAQAYIDGTKRTAFAAVDVFLRVNSLTSPVDSDEYGAAQVELVAERTDSIDAATARFEEWLRRHVG